MGDIVPLCKRCQARSETVARIERPRPGMRGVSGSEGRDSSSGELRLLPGTEGDRSSW
jgi:hypothetical protein